MAGSLIQRKANRFGRNRRTQMSEINVTPFVDVMLVLLIIFMVTAPLLTVGVEVDLPKTKAGAISGQDEPLAVSVDNEGRIFVQDTEVELSTMTARLQAVSENNPDVRIFVRGDASVDYGRVMQVMGTLNAAGFSRVALITQTEGVVKPKKKPNKTKK
ncbi:MAG: protein TolR [Rhodospirillaceae bacterium]|nr:protein TolR [Rhodospirillaceae bacterium]